MLAKRGVRTGFGVSVRALSEALERRMLLAAETQTLLITDDSGNPADLRVDLNDSGTLEEMIGLFSLRNTGGETLTIDRLRLVGSEEFRLIVIQEDGGRWYSSFGWYTFDIPPGATCQAEVTLMAEEEGPKTAQLEFSVADPEARDVVLQVNAQAGPVVEAWIEDSNLEDSIRRALHDSWGTLTVNKLKTLRELHAWDDGITSLNGLEQAVNLEFLILDDNHIVDLSPLSALKNLYYLQAQHNPFTDLTPLQAMPGLTSLHLSGTPVSDLGPLAKLTNLESLDFGYSLLSDLGPLAGLKKLRHLYVSENQITDLAPLAGLTELTSLYLGDNQIVNIGVLAGLSKLEELGLERNQIADIEALRGLWSLEEVDLTENLLDVDSGSAAGSVITTLLSRGVEVDYLPQRGAMLQVQWADDYEDEAIDLPYASLGAASGPVIVTLTNTGPRELSIGSIGVSGADAGDYEVIVKDGEGNVVAGSGFVIAGGAAYTLEVSLRPSFPGPLIAELGFVTDDPRWPAVRIALLGGGRYADDSWSMDAQCRPEGSEVTIKRDAGQVKVWIDEPTAGEPTITRAVDAVDSIYLYGSDGDDVLTIDSTGGRVNPPYGIGIYGGGGINRLIVAGPGRGWIDLYEGDFVAETNLNGYSLTFWSPTHLEVEAAQDLGNLSLGSGAWVNLAPGGDVSLICQSFDVYDQGGLDIADNTFVIRGGGKSQLAQLTPLVRAGYQAGWSNPGGRAIISSSARGASYMAVGLLWNNDGQGRAMRASVGGVAVGLNDVIARLTWQGDANLDGVVNADDYFQIDSGFISQKQGWQNGDFNYDQVINADDYFLIDSAYIGQGSPLGRFAAAGSPVRALPASPFAHGSRLLEDILASE